jgi:hypothetical protein
MKTILALALIATGCFDSLVSDPCATGYALAGDRCVARETPDAGVDGGSDAGSGSDAGPGSDAGDAMPDAMVCTAPTVACGDVCVDTTTDPNNCGVCNRVCASGICDNSACVGDVVGHVVAIGHDYTTFHAGMARVLGNAIALGAATPIRIAYYRGTASETSGSHTVSAGGAGLAMIGRAHVDTAIANVNAAALLHEDVLVIEAQLGDGDALDTLGASWKPALDGFLARGGVVVVVEGVAGTSYRVAHGAGLYDVTTPADATSQQVVVVDPADAVATLVPSPYLAETTSVAFPGVSAVIANSGGDAVVFHITR